MQNGKAYYSNETLTMFQSRETLLTTVDNTSPIEEYRAKMHTP